MRFAWLVVIAGCGGGDKKWPDQPLTTFEGKVGGRAYTIELPEAGGDVLVDQAEVTRRS